MITTTGDALALPQTENLPAQADPTTPQRLASGRFAPGHAGHSPGRPQGSRNRATLALEARLTAKLDALGDKLVALALEGNVAALRMCIDRLAPRPRARPGEVELQAVDTPEDVGQALAEVIAALAAGDIEAGQAKGLAELLEARRKDLMQQENERETEALMQRMVLRGVDGAAE